MNVHPTNDLALYALGLVDERERDTIRRHLETCVTCREELRSHEATLAALSESAELEARRALRDRIVARERRPAFALVPRFALGVSLVVAIVFAAIAIVSLRELDETRAERDQYAQALERVAEGARIVTLTTTVRGRAALVVPRDGQPTLLLDLPAPPPGKQYEAWVIRGGSPVRAGLAPQREGFIAVNLTVPVAPGDIAAVTLEVAGGVDKPTSDPVAVGSA